MATSEGAWRDVVLMSDPAVALIPVVDDGTPVVDASRVIAFDGREDDGTGAARHVRASVLERLLRAADALPGDVRLVLNEGYRPPSLQRAYFERYAARVRSARPGASPEEVRSLASRFVSPPELAPHTSGAAVDVLLTDAAGVELDVGCPIDTDPEVSGGRCYTDHPGVTGDARRLRGLLVEAMTGAGFKVENPNAASGCGCGTSFSV